MFVLILMNFSNRLYRVFQKEVISSKNCAKLNIMRYLLNLFNLISSLAFCPFMTQKSLAYDNQYRLCGSFCESSLFSIVQGWVWTILFQAKYRSLDMINNDVVPFMIKKFPVSAATTEMSNLNMVGGLKTVLNGTEGSL